MKSIADISWEDIEAKYKAAENLPRFPDNIDMLSDGYVFDETKSVKWNKEQVELNNKAYNNERIRLITKKSKVIDEVNNLILEKIQYEAGHDISLRQAKVIWDYAYAEGHSAGFHEIYSYIIDLIDFIDEFLF